MTAFTTFENRIAVLTGGGSGIGRELMLQLVRRGAHVAACDVNRESLEAAVRRARKSNPDVRVTAHLHDVSDQKSVVRFVKAVAKEHGTDAIHLLFNNAGVVGGGSFVVGPRDEWERTFAVSWFGTYYCTRAFLPMLIAADQGVIVNTSSVNGVWASLGRDRRIRPIHRRSSRSGALLSRFLLISVRMPPMSLLCWSCQGMSAPGCRLRPDRGGVRSTRCSPTINPCQASRRRRRSSAR